jgi:hypothetical protein
MSNKYLEKVAATKATMKDINEPIKSSKLSSKRLKELHMRKATAKTVLNPSERMALKAGKAGVIVAGIGAAGYGAKKLYDKAVSNKDKK